MGRGGWGRSGLAGDKAGGGGFAEADESFLGKGELSCGGGGDAPGSAEAGTRGGEPGEGPGGELGGGDPPGEHADAEAELYDLLDGFDGAELDPVAEGGAGLE